MKPILFSTPMVQAILEGRKSQTRRILKLDFLDGFNPEWSGYSPIIEYGKIFLEGSNHRDATKQIKLPYGNIGSILWVRETWNLVYRGAPGDKSDMYYIYAADMSDYKDRYWYPSIHMPKEACRLFLKITDLRAQRLQDIAEDDARAEGANWSDGKNVGWEEKMHRSAIDRFASIWDSINAKRGYGWEVNPWVLAITFERVEKPKD